MKCGVGGQRNGIVGGRKKRIDEELCRCDQAKEAGDAEEAEEVGAFHVVMCSMEPSCYTEHVKEGGK